MSLQFHPLPVQHIERDADALIVGFGVPPALRDTFAFAPGQYLTLRAEVDGEDLRRSYSICSGLDDGALRVGIRLLPGGVFSGWAAGASCWRARRSALVIWLTTLSDLTMFRQA